jgi:hypothetical protein
MSAVNRYLLGFTKEWEECGDVFVVVGEQRALLNITLQKMLMGRMCIHQAQRNRGGPAAALSQFNVQLQIWTFNREGVVSIPTSRQELPPQKAPKSEARLPGHSELNRT